MQIDKTGWGPNMLAIAMKNRNNTVRFIYRGWRISLILLILIGIILFVFSKMNGINLLDDGALPETYAHLPFMLKYIIMPLLVIGVLLAFLYNLRVEFDFRRKRVRCKKGFDLLSKSVQCSFGDIDAFLIQEQGVLLPMKIGDVQSKPVHAGWDIIVKGRADSDLPNIRFWRAARQEQARKIAETLTGLIGCKIEEGSRRSIWS